MLRILFVVADYARQLAQGYWSYLGPGSKKDVVRNSRFQPNGERDNVAGVVMINFSESGHPFFRGSSLLKEEI